MTVSGIDHVKYIESIEPTVWAAMQPGVSVFP